eukprot:10193631-Lingulodinium_polyedra.AAC.1
MQCMQFTAADTRFMVGEHVVHRTRGWAMGSPISGPAAAFDLETATEEAYEDAAVARRAGWAVNGLTTRQT